MRCEWVVLHVTSWNKCVLEVECCRCKRVCYWLHLSPSGGTEWYPERRGRKEKTSWRGQEELVFSIIAASCSPTTTTAVFLFFFFLGAFLPRDITPSRLHWKVWCSMWSGFHMDKKEVWYLSPSSAKREMNVSTRRGSHPHSTQGFFRGLVPFASPILDHCLHLWDFLL